MASSSNSALSATRPAPRKLLGSEAPRIFTPPLRRLTRKTSAGFECIAFAETVLGIVLLPWQKWLLIHALELLPDGTFRFRTVVLLVARQNGKSTLMQVLSLWRMFVDGAPLVIGTAQNLDLAEEQWQGAVEMAEDVPELAAEVAQVSKVNGKKFLRLTTGERYKVATASRRGGRGLSGDLVLLDELREHQTWNAWAAVTKTTMARLHAQVWAASNAGDSTSIVLAFLRGLAHHALGNPDGLPAIDMPDDPEVDEEDGDSLGIFEWSAPPGCGLWDREGWAWANPSLGYTITEKAIASAIRTDPEPVSRTEVLCQWVDGFLESIFGAGAWEACAAEMSPPKKNLTFGLAVSTDRAWSSIGVAQGGDTIKVGAVQRGRGTDWVVKRAKQLQKKHGAGVVIAGNGPGKALVPELKAAGVAVTIAASADAMDAAEQFYDRVQIQAVLHPSHPELDEAVAAAQWKQIGDRRALSRKGVGDVSMLEAVQLAAWAAANEPNYDVMASAY